MGSTRLSRKEVVSWVGLAPGVGNDSQVSTAGSGRSEELREHCLREQRERIAFVEHGPYAVGA